MATDPTQRIREHEGDSPLDLDLQPALAHLAALDPSPDIPYLTITIDWRPDGQDPRRRAGRLQVEQEMEALLAEMEYRDPAAESIRADRDAVLAFLDGEVDPASQGVAIVACSALGVFETSQLGLPLDTSVTAGPTPALAAIARLAEDFEPYAVLLVDQRDAALSFISQAHWDRGVTLEGTDYPRKQQAGGWSQRRFQARADERVNAFATDIAEEVRKALEETGATALIVAGDEVMTSALDEAFHQTVKDRIVGTLRLDARASDADIVRETMPLIAEVERQREAEAVRLLHENRGTGGLAALGADDVLTALQAGQVMTLVMTDDFSSPGWADYSLPLLGAGKRPKRHPAGGNPRDLVDVRVEEEAIRLAIQTGADIEIVQAVVPVGELNSEDMEIRDAGEAPPRTDAARSLDEVGGIGALLRYALSDEQSVAEA